MDGNPGAWKAEEAGGVWRATTSRNLALVKGSLGFLGDSGVKNPPANSRDTGLIPVSGRSPGE